MKIIARSMLLFSILCVAVATAPAADEQIGSVIALEGRAIARAQSGATRVLTMRSPVFLNDTIITGPNAKTQILLNDETVISQGAESEMLIDEYIYNPEDSGDNATSVNVIRGMFRVITGNITRLNPERFRVRSGLATIGIRGCDVGFNVTERGQNVYVIALHGYESVVVQAREQVGRGEWQGLVDGQWSDPAAARQHLINVTRPNRVVSITTTGEMEERDFSPDELIEFLNAVTPESVDDMDDPVAGDDESDSDAEEDSPADADGESVEDDQDSADETTDVVDDTADTETEGEMPDHFVDAGDDPDDLDADDALIDDTGTIDDTLIDPIVDIPDPTPVVPVTGNGDDDEVTTTTDDGIGTTDPEPEPDNGVDTGNGAPDDDIGTTDPEPEPDNGTDTGNGYPEPVFNVRGSGHGWDWGVWESGSVTESVEFRAQQPISETDFQAIADGAVMYNLHGEGVAAAIIEHNAQKAFVEGISSLYVQVGQEITPNWDGSFSMDNASGDALSFDAMGNIQPTGLMTADNVTHYNMQVNGRTFNGSSISDQSITGQLVGPGTGETPITGAVGSFRFDHDHTEHGPASVRGGFGTNLSADH